MGPELGMKTTAGAYCFAEEKAQKSAVVIDQVSEIFRDFETLIEREIASWERLDHSGNNQLIGKKILASAMTRLTLARNFVAISIIVSLRWCAQNLISPEHMT